MTEKEIKKLMREIAAPIAEHVQSAQRPLLARIRELEDRANVLEARLAGMQQR